MKAFLKQDLNRYVRMQDDIKKLMAEIRNEDLPLPILNDDDAEKIGDSLVILKKFLANLENALVDHINDCEDDDLKWNELHEGQEE